MINVMHDVVLPGEGTLHQCPICGVVFTGHYGRASEQRWTDAQEKGSQFVAELLHGDDGITHNPSNCLGRYLPGRVLANEPDRRKAEALAREVVRKHFNGTDGASPEVT
ncbi:hypothetical protein ABZU94_21910 [Streptomyces mirabilis]